MSSPAFTIALAGNPNSGKTTIFNALTHLRQHVGNYPGVTVETKEGLARLGGRDVRVVDLPGTYSLTAHSLEEIVARNALIEHRPDVVVDIVDASNLERNLYLAVQLAELGAPLVLAFNMSDLAKARGYAIDTVRLSELLGVPIVETVGSKRQGLDELLAAAGAAAADPQAAVARPRTCIYGGEVEPHVQHLADALAARCPDLPARARWFAVKLLEHDRETIRRLRSACGQGADGILIEAARLRRHIQAVCGDPPEIILADQRYGFISGACAECVRQTVEARHDRSDRIDAVLTHRYLGLPIFALIMFLVFQATFTAAGPLVDVLDGWKSALAGLVRSWGLRAASPLLASLLADGIIEGVGAVVAFVPLVAMLYLAIAVLEDSGYMARAAFVLDGLMHRIGLHGKSFIPMLIGFGCTVPAILATRIIEHRRDRLTTILVLPLMSCGARLSVYALLIGALIPSRVVLGLVRTGVDAAGEPTWLLAITNQAVVLLALYAGGIVLAVAGVKLLRRTIFRGDTSSFVMELPPYRMPALRGLAIHTWERMWLYLRKAGTIILGLVVVLWALKTFPRLDAETQRQFDARRAEVLARGAMSQPQPQAELAQIAAEQARRRVQHSIIGRLGRAVAPAFWPCGFRDRRGRPDWRLPTALLGALVAKEVFVGQMALLLAADEAQQEAGGGPGGGESLRRRIRAEYTPLQGFCVMLFILVASPCVATLAATRREAGGWRWAAIQWTGLTVLGWLLAAGAYLVGSALGIGTAYAV